MEPKAKMLQTCHIISQIGLQWLRSYKAPSTYFPTLDQTFDGLGTRKVLQEPRAGRRSTELRSPLEQKALPRMCFSLMVYYKTIK